MTLFLVNNIIIFQISNLYSPQLILPLPQLTETITDA